MVFSMRCRVSDQLACKQLFTFMSLVLKWERKFSFGNAFLVLKWTGSQVSGNLEREKINENLPPRGHNLIEFLSEQKKLVYELNNGKSSKLRYLLSLGTKRALRARNLSFSLSNTVKVFNSYSRNFIYRKTKCIRNSSFILDLRPNF